MHSNKYANIFFAITGVLLVWTGVHLPAVLYGTHHTPLHVSYWSADEQSPINGALHMLQNKSILGMRNQHTLYYGPVFALLAVPAVVVDYGVHVVTGGSATADAYKQGLIFDWGSILVFARLIALLFGFLGILAVFFLFSTNTLNPGYIAWVPYAASGAVSACYLYFQLSAFFRHWIFVVTFLLWQLYLAIRIMEGGKHLRLYWVGQVILTVLTFGISYLSLLYQVFWIPLLISWLRDRDLLKMRQFGIYILSSLVGFGLIVWWHPYAFIRLLGLMGIIEPIAIGAVLDLTTAPDTGRSFLFYGTLLFLHTAPLLVAAFLLHTKQTLRTLISTYWFWLLTVPLVVNYLVFSMPAHHEARYMLPTVVLLVIVSFASLSVFHERFMVRSTRRILVVALIVVWLFSNVVQITGWTRMMAAGPVERREIIPQILAWQEENPDARILVSKDWPLGWVHTREAYQDYVARYEKSTYELWQYLIQHEGPEGVPQLNVYYIHEPREELTDELMAEYDHVVRHVWPAVGKDIARESPQDEFDIRPWNVWRYRDFQERYEILK